MVKRIYEHFLIEEGNESFGYREILRFMNEHPEIEAINRKYSRDEGLKKSIEEDKLIDIKS